MAPLRRGGTRLVVTGLTPLTRALKRTEGDAAKRLRTGLRAIGNVLRDRARVNAPVGPRPRRSKTKPLRSSIKTSVTVKGVDVYSAEDHSIVQDVGGRVGRGRSTVLRRDHMSHYMTRAQRETRPEVSRQTDVLLDEFGRDLEK